MIGLAVFCAFTQPIKTQEGHKVRVSPITVHVPKYGTVVITSFYLN